ncbi:DUF4136 domain-containing protein [Flavobacteriaceae bacterium]|nr:DUF4136 domain-containing protein [Flavobacteriaceae bacterium]MDC1492259.1 DUF4136 domain-containing protein [Flavobacteriaceae bacterium]
MKNYNKLLILFISLIFLSCSSVRVTTDYNNEVDFSSYKTYAFSKKGIDKAQINELDKKRILKALEIELSSIGLRKNSIDPDIVVSIFTAVNEQINITNSYNYLGYSYGPWYDFNYNTSTTQGTLYIDIIDFKKNELVWQGIGKGYISENTKKKEEQIKSFVNKILLQYPVK